MLLIGFVIILKFLIKVSMEACDIDGFTFLIDALNARPKNTKNILNRKEVISGVTLILLKTKSLLEFLD